MPTFLRFLSDNWSPRDISLDPGTRSANNACPFS